MPRNRTIGVLSRETGVKITTIRYYESIGVLPEGERTPSGHRVYDAQAVERLKFVRHARELGLDMNVIRELIALQDCPAEECASADDIARRHLVHIRTRILQLRALEKEVTRITDACAGGTVENCRVIQSLAEHEGCITDHAKRSPLQRLE